MPTTSEGSIDFKKMTPAQKLAYSAIASSPIS